MKLLEQVLDFSMCKIINIDGMQFAFVSDRGTTDTIVHQLEAKYISANIPLYVAFVVLDKTFMCQGRSTLGDLCANKWAVHVNQSMYSSALSHVRTYGQYS